MRTARQAYAAQVARLLRSRSGLTCLEIATHTGLEPALVRVALQDGRKAGALKSQGATQGTRWFCA